MSSSQGPKYRLIVTKLTWKIESYKMELSNTTLRLMLLTYWIRAKSNQFKYKFDYLFIFLNTGTCNTCKLGITSLQWDYASFWENFIVDKMDAVRCKG